MAFWKIITLTCAATIFAEAARYHQKRETSSNICDPVYTNTNKVQCYCIKDTREAEVVRSAECYLINDDVKLDDSSWNAFKTLNTANRITLTNTRGITLKYIPTNALKQTDGILKLDIKYGNIEKIGPFAFANLSSVEEITLRDNQINILAVNAFAHHKDLTVISLDTNNIVEINRDAFIDLPALERLFLTSNKITTIHDRAFMHLTNLRELEIDRNVLFSLNSETFSGLKNLQKLDLSSNSLEVIGDNTFLPLENMRSLNLEGNKIQMLDDKAFNGLIKLQSLSLAHNKLIDIDNVKVFEGLESLISLSLRGNQIHQLKPEVMAPILRNFYGNISVLDVEDNNFPCSCRLDWFISLMNKTRNSHLKLAIENFKCIPDSNLRDAWAKTEENEKNTVQLFEDEETQVQTNDYEYYDDTQLNGKLFYIDVRDLLNCSHTAKRVPYIHIDTTVKPVNKITEITKAMSSPIVGTTTTIKPVPNIDVTTEMHDLKLTTKMEMENEMSSEKVESFTTTRLVTVSAKPRERNVFEMASDQPKPDKIKAHRSIQDINDVPKGNTAHRNLGCVTILLMILYLRISLC